MTTCYYRDEKKAAYACRVMGQNMLGSTLVVFGMGRVGMCWTWNTLFCTFFVNNQRVKYDYKNYIFPIINYSFEKISCRRFYGLKITLGAYWAVSF